MPVMPRRLRTALRTAGRTAGVLTAVALVLLGAGTPAARAHDQLVTTVPAAGATVPAPASVELRLRGTPQALGTQVVVTAPGGAVVSRGEPELRGSTVVQPLADGLAGGPYTVAWRVTSADGHPLSGTSSFTVAAAGAPAPPAPDPAAPSEASASQPADPWSGSAAPAAAAGVVLLAAGAVLLRLRRRA